MLFFLTELLFVIRQIIYNQIILSIKKVCETGKWKRVERNFLKLKIQLDFIVCIRFLFSLKFRCRLFYFPFAVSFYLLFVFQSVLNIMTFAGYFTYCVTTFLFKLTCYSLEIRL